MEKARQQSITTFDLNGVTLYACPSLLIMAAAMLTNVISGADAIGTVFVVVAFVLLLVIKLRMQIWLARQYDIRIARTKIAPFMAEILLRGCTAQQRRDVHMLGLCVPFGSWAILSLMADVSGQSLLAAILAHVAQFALATGILSAIPIFGLDGGQALFAHGCAKSSRVRDLLGLVGQAVSFGAGVVLVLMLLWSLDSGVWLGAMESFVFLVLGCHIFQSSLRLRETPIKKIHF